MDIKEFSIKYHGLVLQPHHLEWIDFLDSVHRRGILLAPRGHGKTTTINLIYLSWIIANNPSLRILLVSHSKEMAESFSRSVRNVMENPELQEEFGLTIGTPWRANSWRLEDSPQAKPTLECKGAMGRMTGWRGDMVIFDDLLEINAVSSEATRAKLKAWRDTEVLPAINPTENEKVIVVGTRKHIDDWYGECLINPDYIHRVDRAFLDDDQTKTLWPHILDEDGNIIAEMFTAERLHERKREIGTLRFEQEYMNNPSPPEGLEWKMSWLKFYEHLPDGRFKYYMGVDPSSGSVSKRTQSYFAICVVAHDTEQDNIYIIRMYRGKDTKREQVAKTLEWAGLYKPDAIYIESVFQYTHIYEAVRKQFPHVHPIDYIHTPIKGTQVVKKEERIKNVCGPAFEMGRLFLKRPELDPYIKTFLEYEYRPFPLGNFDMLDALTLAIHHLTKGKQITEIPWHFPGQGRR
jgi:hypothetical protein